MGMCEIAVDYMDKQSTEIEKFAIELGEKLSACHRTLAVAESCTGGWLAKSITDVAGSSHWFDRGIVTYSNQSKIDLVGVKPETLARFGAVSESVVKEMALGLLACTTVDYTIAITGIAGPEGGSLEKPVGTVYFAWARRQGDILVNRKTLQGDRAAVRCQSIITALSQMALMIEANCG